MCTASRTRRPSRSPKPFGRDVKFPGFDGNNEAEYLGTARFLVNEAEAFPTFKGRDLNSRAPLMDAYSRMFAAFDKVRHGRPSADQIIRILKEMVHPEARK